MDAHVQSRRIREHLWHRLESEHRALGTTLVDVEALAAAGSFETARKRFGQFRLAHERHLHTVRTLESVLVELPETGVLVTRARRERARVFEQSDRIWSQLCRERNARLPRMLARLSALGAAHDETLQRLILAEPPPGSLQLGAHQRLVWRLGEI